MINNACERRQNTARGAAVMEQLWSISETHENRLLKKKSVSIGSHYLIESRKQWSQVLRS